MKTWPKVKLGEYAPIIPAAPLESDSVWLLNLDAIESGTGTVLRRELVSADSVGSSTVWFDKKNVLYSKLRPYLNKVVLPSEAGCATSELWPLRPLEGKLLREYLTYFLRSKAFVLQISDKVAGAKMPRVVAKEFREIALPLPALAEQERIAAELDAVVATLKKRQAQLAELDALVEARFVELFSEKQRDCNAVVKLGEICSPKQWKTLAIADLKPFGYPVYGANGVIGFYSEYNHEEPTLLVTCRGATCGCVNISQPFSYVNGNAMALDALSPRVNLLYLYYFLKGRGFADVITGSAQPQIIRASIASVEIPLPPLELQERFAAEVERVEAIKAKVRDGIAETQTLFDALTQKYFG